jgi:hypothetical protein
MNKYLVQAKLMKYYEVPVEAESREKALELINDFIAEDFEDFETNAQWDFEVEDNE